jgi:hypothetical protein
MAYMPSVNIDAKKSMGQFSWSEPWSEPENKVIAHNNPIK